MQQDSFDWCVAGHAEDMIPLKNSKQVTLHSAIYSTAKYLSPNTRPTLLMHF